MGSVPSPVPSPPPSPSAQRLSKRQRVERAQETLDEVKTSMRDQDYRNICEGLQVAHAETDRKLYVLKYVIAKAKSSFDDDGDYIHRIIPYTKTALLYLDDQDYLVLRDLAHTHGGYIKPQTIRSHTWGHIVERHSYASLPKPNISWLMVPHADEGCGHGNKNMPVDNALILLSIIEKQFYV